MAAMNVPWWITATPGEDYDGNPTVTYKTVDGTRVFPGGDGSWRKGTGPGNNQPSYTDDGGDTHQGDVVSAPSTVDATGKAGFIPAGSPALGNSGGAFLNLTGGNTPTVLDTAASGAPGGASIGSLLQAATQGGTPGYLPPSDAFTQVQQPVQSNAGFEFGPLSVMALPFAASALAGGAGALGFGGEAAGLDGGAEGLISAETAAGPESQFAGWSPGPLINPTVGYSTTAGLSPLDAAIGSAVPASTGGALATGAAGSSTLAALLAAPAAAAGAAGGAAAGAGAGLPSLSTAASAAGLASAAAGLGGGGGQTQAEMDAANAGQQAGQDAQGELGSTSTTTGTLNDPSQYPINPATGLPFTPSETPTTGTGNKNLDAIQRILNGTATDADIASVLGRAAPGVLGGVASAAQMSQLSDLANQQRADEAARYADQVAREQARYTTESGRQDTAIAAAAAARAGDQATVAPSQARYESSFAPGFTMANDPGYTDALNASATSTLHGLSVGGNPAGNPNAWQQTQTDVYNKTAYPALQAYRSGNAATGFNSAAASGAASVPGIPASLGDPLAGNNLTVSPGGDAAKSSIAALGTTAGNLGGAVNSVFNPVDTSTSSLADLYKKLSALNSGGNIFAVQ